MNEKMTSEEKREASSRVAEFAKTAADKAAGKTGWKKVLWWLLATLAGGAALWLNTGCTPAQQEFATETMILILESVETTK